MLFKFFFDLNYSQLDQISRTLGAIHKGRHHFFLVFDPSLSHVLDRPQFNDPLKRTSPFPTFNPPPPLPSL